MSKEIIYCLPGLGLDHRLFNRLKLKHAELRYIDWLEPGKDENLVAYAKRIAKLLPSDPISLLGVSLGGIVSIEISKIRKINQLFLISTIKNSDEMPAFLKWLNHFPLNNKQTAKFAMEASIALKPFYDRSDPEGIELFKSMVKSASADFINWGVKQISKWEQTEKLHTPYIHLHGTEDLIFPIKNIDRAITIKGGTHYTIFNQGDKISRIIDAELLHQPSKGSKPLEG